MVARKLTLEVCAKKSAVASFLRPAWAVAFDAPWQLAALLLAIVAAWRGVLLFGSAGGGGPWMVAHFLFMAALPFGFLTYEGRKAVGLRLPSRCGWLLWGPLLGALVTTAVSFGVIHLFHHGLALTDGIQVLAVSGSIWLVLVMGLSVLFTLCRTRGGSIWPSIASHAAFNVAMVIVIVFLWPR
jgi:hypothetical protein